MNQRIPLTETTVTEEEVWAALDREYPGLEAVKRSLERCDYAGARQALAQYLEHRTNVQYYYDYRQLPLTPIETDQNPYLFQASLGLEGSLKEFCLFAGKKLSQHIYVRPGRERKELDLGEAYEGLPHFNFYEDQGKKHRSTLDIFVRGTFMEYLSVWYHETGDRQILEFTKEFLERFWQHYPLQVECTEADAAHFSLTEERDAMSVGWLALNYASLLYTRLPYELDPDFVFEIVKHLWFLGMQFRRFDTDEYHKYNHHLWERGLVPFILGTLFPEFPGLKGMKKRGAEVVRLHVLDDFNEEGGYNEHSISYWCGAALAEMLCRGVYLARLNGEALLDENTLGRIGASFDILARISPPGECFPSLGDNGGTAVAPILYAGAASVGSELCRAVLDHREEACGPLDYCSDRVGFVCTRSSWRSDANYLLLSAKVRCGDTGHNHMDLLSLFISIHGQEMIGEPYARALYHAGCVGSELRGYLYNMESHNTVLAYGKPVQPDYMYASKWGVLRPDTPVAVFQSEQAGCYVEAYHEAYTHCRHVRKIRHNRELGFMIRDELVGGDRLPEPHIQRWHLHPDVTCEQQDERTLLLTHNGAGALLIWNGTPQLKLWRKQELCPQVVSEPQKLGLIIDVSFAAEQFTPAGRIGTVAQEMLILDVTNKKPSAESVQKAFGWNMSDWN